MLSKTALKEKLGYRYAKAIADQDPSLNSRQVLHVLSGESADSCRIKQVQDAIDKAIKVREQVLEFNNTIKS